MKRHLLFYLLCLIPALSAAQVRFGVKGGLNVASQPVVSTNFASGFAANQQPRVAWHLGGIARIGLGEHFFLQPELLFTSKGMVYETKYLAADPNDPLLRNATTSETPAYIELPVNIGGKIALNNTVSLFGMVGPYVAYGVSGKMTTHIVGGTPMTNDIQWLGSRKTFERFDYGLNAGLGAEIRNFLVSVQYSRGFANVRPENYAIRANNQVFSLSAGYLLGKAK